MSRPVLLHLLDRASLAHAQGVVERHHYLRRPVDARCSVEGYAVHLRGIRLNAGFLLVGRPQATRCYPWYGSVEDVERGRAECTRWQVLNLARIWFHPEVQPGGTYHGPEHLPGFLDRRGLFRSTLVSAAILELRRRVVLDYLLRRPPCFLDEPYGLRWLLSYCDSRIHRGVVYRASRFERFRANAEGMETWRIPLPALTPEEDVRVRNASRVHPRSIAYRERRAQLSLAGVV